MLLTISRKVVKVELNATMILMAIHTATLDDGDREARRPGQGDLVRGQPNRYIDRVANSCLKYGSVARANQFGPPFPPWKQLHHGVAHVLRASAAHGASGSSLKFPPAHQFANCTYQIEKMTYCC